MTHLKAHRQTFIDLQRCFWDLATSLERTDSSATRVLDELQGRLFSVQESALDRVQRATEALDSCLENPERDSDCSSQSYNLNEAIACYNYVMRETAEIEVKLNWYRQCSGHVAGLVDVNIPQINDNLNIREKILEKLLSLGVPLEITSGGSASVYSQQAIRSTSVSNAIKPASVFDAVLKNAPDHDPKAKTDFIYQNLDRVFFDEYEKMTSTDADFLSSGQPELGSISMPDTRVTYLYDMGNDNDTEFRVIAAYWYSPPPVKSDRDSSRMRAWLGPTDQVAKRILNASWHPFAFEYGLIKQYGTLWLETFENRSIEVRYDKGHMLPHSQGGGLDINLFLQKREINQGRSDEGKIFRRMENYAKDNVGTLTFIRFLFD